DPTSNLEQLARRPDGLHVRGWVVDPDSAAPTSVDVYADGVGVARLSASVSRPDVGAAFPSYGDAHGFDAVLPGVGAHVGLYAINVGPGFSNPLMGCKFVPGANPIGHVDAVTRQPNGLRVRGWALEPDTDGPGFVDVYANGVGVGRITAGNSR